jgi:hypothetical protein
VTVDDARQRLVGVIGRARTVKVSREHWIAASVLGGLRQASNDAIQASHRDRGSEKNVAGHLQGCFGELLIGTLVETELSEASVYATLLDWDGAVDEVDATVEIKGHRFTVETKCHLHEPAKQRFLINVVAAERSKARNARSFVPIFSKLGAGVALIGSPLLLEDVLAWPTETFHYGDPAKRAWLRELMPPYFGYQLDQAVDAVTNAAEVVSPDDLSSLASSARARFERHRKAGFQLDQGPRASIEVLVAIS